MTNTENNIYLNKVDLPTTKSQECLNIKEDHNDKKLRQSEHLQANKDTHYYDEVHKLLELATTPKKMTVSRSIFFLKKRVKIQINKKSSETSQLLRAESNKEITKAHVGKIFAHEQYRYKIKIDKILETETNSGTLITQTIEFKIEASIL
ncbi:hypothetical protein C2G38_2165912 [Gigaspora rosea]|uniref:Uncharacterized protein n=1 Tax=Gigaspora rosea TaxID=44941 RepID=A0A397VSD3_9GLOM|nr:hypothetical protein C2G38_2165912 [Gigaspora rosea]